MTQSSTACCIARGALAPATEAAISSFRNSDPSAAPVWICTHEKCRGQEWADARMLQVDHDPKDLDRKQEAHVYGLWSKVAIDPDAPVVGVLGLIAPFSSDGTPATRIAVAFAAQMGEMPPEDDGANVDVGALVAEGERRRGARKPKGDAS